MHLFRFVEIKHLSQEPACGTSSRTRGAQCGSIIGRLMSYSYRCVPTAMNAIMRHRGAPVPGALGLKLPACTMRTSMMHASPRLRTMCFSTHGLGNLLRVQYAEPVTPFKWHPSDGPINNKM